MSEELSERDQLEHVFSDVYKDAYGFRPRHFNISAMSDAEIEREIGRLNAVIAEQDEKRIAMQNQAIVRFNTLVDRLIADGAGDRDTAIRWIHQAEGTDGDDEFLCYCLGLPYGFFRKQAA